MHKRNYSLVGGECHNDDSYSIMTFDVKHDEKTDDILLLLPETADMDAVLGTPKFMIKQAQSEAFGRGASGRLEIVGPGGEGARADEVSAEGHAELAGCDSGPGTAKLSW